MPVEARTQSADADGSIREVSFSSTIVVCSVRTARCHAPRSRPGSAASCPPDGHSVTDRPMDWPKRFGVWRLGIGTVVLGLSFFAYYLTGSIALYSDALESIVNVATAIVALFAVHVSAKPADAGHLFGHSKVEYFSAVIEGVLIVVAALSILRQAYMGFLNPTPLDAPLLGMAVNGAAGVLNALWCWVLITQGRKHRSPALVADGCDLVSDVLTSVGVLVGVGAAYGTGVAILDPAIAVLVALNILWSGWGIMKESVGGLMDEEVPRPTLERVQNVI